mgnify:CR=1 FL=1|nr:MAG TPA: site specific tyrosine recombinase [Caudoviricetes sp.]
MVVQFPQNTVSNTETETVTVSTKQAPQIVHSPACKIARPASVQITGNAFEEEVPEKKKEAAEPIKSLDDIQYISQYLIQNGRYRDNLLFVAGINFGLRCGDLLKLKVGHILTEDGTAYRDKIVIREQKTKKIREAYLNDAICDAADLYFGSVGMVDLNDYLFKSQCNRVKSKGTPMTVRSVERLLKEIINDECGLDVHASTHTLRKTFSYHILMNAPDRTRAVEFLMKILGHSSPSVTLAYAGITKEEIEQSYKNLNLAKDTATFQWSLRGKLVS